MLSYNEFIAETFNSPQPIIQGKDTKRKKVSTFYVGTDLYTITFHKKGNGIVVEFSMKDNGKEIFNVTGRNEPFKVLSTVLEHIRQYIKDNQPETVKFNAAHHSIDDKGQVSMSHRSKLYGRMVKRFSKEVGYTSVSNINKPTLKTKPGRKSLKDSKWMGWLSKGKKMSDLHNSTEFTLTKTKKDA